MFKKLKQAAIGFKGLSVIHAGTQIVGDIRSEGEVRIEGNLEGDITAKCVVIGVSGLVMGRISADAADVFGTVTGEIKARSVKLGSTAQVKGNITQENIVIEEGAVLEGCCHRLDETIHAGAPDADLLLTDGRKNKKKDCAHG